MRTMSWKGQIAERKHCTFKRAAWLKQYIGFAPGEHTGPMLGSQHLRDLEKTTDQNSHGFLHGSSVRENLCFNRQDTGASSACVSSSDLGTTGLSASCPPSHWSSQQRLQFNWLVYQDLCARRFNSYNNSFMSSAALFSMRESADSTGTDLAIHPTVGSGEQDMKLSSSHRANEEETLLTNSQIKSKCSDSDSLMCEVPAVLSKHREQLGVGLPAETSKLLKDILQHKDRAILENNNSLKGLMMNARDGQDNADLIAQLLKNNPSRSRSPLAMEERGTLRVGARGDSESESDRDSYTDTCRYNGDQDLGENDTVDLEMKEDDDNCDEKNCWNPNSFDDNVQAGNEGSSVEAKRARVENIITSMRPSPSGLGGEAGSQLSPDMRRPKRKQYQPQQHDSKYTPHSASKYRKQEERDQLKEQLKFVQKTLQQMQKQYMDLFDEEEKDCSETTSRTLNGSKYFDFLSDKLCSKKEESPLCRNFNFNTTGFDASNILKQASRSLSAQDACTSSKNSKDGLKDFANVLKYEIADAVGSAIDGVVSKFLNPLTKSKRIDNANTVNTQSPESESKPVEMSSPQSSEVLPKSPEPSENFTSKKESQTSSKTPKVSDKINERPEKCDRIENRSAFMDSPLRNFMDMPRSHHGLPHLSPYPGLPFYLPTQVHAPTPMMFGVEPEQTEALPLVVNTPKKKRTKVTDTRLSPRAARVLLQENSVPVSSHSDLSMGRHSPSAYPHLFPMLPTSVAIPNPSLQHSDIMRFYEEQVYNHHHAQSHSDTAPQSSTHSPLHADQGSPGASHISASEGAHLSNGKRERDVYSPNDGSYDSFHMTSTLTPMHLRKAKLMFFFVRYPSSAILKMYFPDIKFNKNNTAQLVKWFSNFREFYYIQMEKYARQAIAEGVKSAEDLIVTTDSELYRILNLHYNRNNQLEVPESFRLVVQGTLREFYKAIYTGKDTEQSWKKAIYKVIARMDDVLPEYFKSPNWMEQLGEM